MSNNNEAFNYKKILSNLNINEKLVDRLMTKPEVSERSIDHVYSSESSPELKAFHSGEDIGYSRGHNSGFGSGAAIGIIAGIGITVGLLKLLSNNDD